MLADIGVETAKLVDMGMLVAVVAGMTAGPALVHTSLAMVTIAALERIIITEMPLSQNMEMPLTQNMAKNMGITKEANMDMVNMAIKEANMETKSSNHHFFAAI